MASRLLRQFVVAAAILTPLSSYAAANLVVNGNFESGDFSGWTTAENSYPLSIVTDTVEDGTYAAEIAGYSSGPDTLSQSIATVAGQAYTLSFWRAQGAPGPVTILSVSWDGSTVYTEDDSSASEDIPYAEFVETANGTGSDTLTFTASNDPGYTYLDNVSVTAAATPEPPGWFLIESTLCVLACALLRRVSWVFGSA